MKAGTAILMVFLILLGSMVVLGYLMNATSDLRQQNVHLQEQLDGLQQDLIAEQQKNRELEGSLALITADLNNTKSSLEKEREAKKQAVADKTICEIQGTLSTLPGKPILSSVLMSTVLVSILGVMGMQHWVSRSKLHVSLPQVNGQELVTVRLPREQLKRYIEFQRKEKQAQ